MKFSDFSLSEIRRVVWPIEGYENKKFLPMALMMFCILFNYSMLRSIKDSLVVTNIGPEALSFLKTYIVLPCAVISIIIYAKLCNLMNQQKVFYTISAFFVGYLLLFTLFLYPNADMVHPDVAKIEAWSLKYPNFQWFIRIAGKWSYATFYTIAELWGSVMLSLLFWQFANKITRTEEAKRFYSMFGLLGNFSLPLSGYILRLVSREQALASGSEQTFTYIMLISVLAGILVIAIYAHIQRNVLTDPRLYDSSAQPKSKKSKTKLSLIESMKVVFSSKYLGLLVILVLAYGISMNLVEGVWKAKIRELYPTQSGYLAFMGNFQIYQGIAAIIFMLIGSNILRKVSWGAAATFTPVMILVTGLAFFSFLLFDDVISLYVTGFLSASPLLIAIWIGIIQNVLSKATKYSLFDSTKEMAYIPLDTELQTKGKAAVDVVGGRLGKSVGGIIQSTFFILFPSYTFVHATPYFATVFFFIVGIWVYAVRALNKEYNKALTVSSNK